MGRRFFCLQMQLVDFNPDCPVCNRVYKVNIMTGYKQFVTRRIFGDIGVHLRVIKATFRALLVVCLLFSYQSIARAQAVPPYPPSTVIANITWDFNNLIRMAPGSDLWPVTWAENDQLYTSFGDGGGFGGDNSSGRVSMGFSRINGSPTSFTTSNVNGGANPENSATWGCSECGKGVGLIAVNNNLYVWINKQDVADSRFQLAWSSNNGVTWQKVTSWNFIGSVFGEVTFLNFGKNNAGARDSYVYMYGIKRVSGKPGIEMARVPRNAITDRAQYQFYAGMDGNNPIWDADIANRQSVFTDPAGVGIPTVIYNPGLQRYIMAVAHGAWTNSGLGRLGMFDSENPWGPWTTVQYNENWGNFSGPWLIYNMPTKTPNWLSPDGKTFHLMFSGTGVYDSFNLIKGEFILQSAGTLPSTPTGFSINKN